jgi:large subunit ribosomal protein L1
MAELGKIGKLLGPKGLMPNPKTGTVTSDVIKAISDVKKGRVEYRVDKNGNIHSIIGKASFKVEDLKSNYDVIYETICKAKPATVKGVYIKNIVITTTMGPGIKVLI